MASETTLLVGFGHITYQGVLLADIARLKKLQNERLIGFEGNESVFLNFQLADQQDIRTSMVLSL